MSDRVCIPGTLGIIPARGGSKGLPGKNLRPLGGAPLIAHTIRAAVESRIERVIVSTDDEEIAAAARDHGAEVPFKRPEALSGDEATSLSVLLHGLRFMEDQARMEIQHVVFLQPTSPFRMAWHIDEALDQYLRSGKTSLIAVTEVQEHHPYFMFTCKDNDTLSPLFEMEQRPLRRQDLPTMYRINGALYISRRDYYLDLDDSAAIFDWRSLSGYSMDAPSSLDINDAMDFQRAELTLAESTHVSKRA